MRRERYTGTYSRSFDMSAIKTDDITASYADGILRLTLPKKDEIKPLPARQISIS